MVTLDPEPYIAWVEEYAHRTEMFDVKREVKLRGIRFFGGEWHALLYQDTSYAGVYNQMWVPLRLCRSHAGDVYRIEDAK